MEQEGSLIEIIGKLGLEQRQIYNQVAHAINKFRDFKAPFTEGLPDSVKAKLDGIKMPIAQHLLIYGSLDDLDIPLPIENDHLVPQMLSDINQFIYSEQKVVNDKTVDTHIAVCKLYPDTKHPKLWIKTVSLYPYPLTPESILKKFEATISLVGINHVPKGRPIWI